MPEDLHKDNHSEKAIHFLTVCRRESSSKTQVINCGVEKTSRENILLFEICLYFKMHYKIKEKQIS